MVGRGSKEEEGGMIEKGLMEGGKGPGASYYVAWENSTQNYIS